MTVHLEGWQLRPEGNAPMPARLGECWFRRHDTHHYMISFDVVRGGFVVSQLVTSKRYPATPVAANTAWRVITPAFDTPEAAHVWFVLEGL